MLSILLLPISPVHANPLFKGFTAEYEVSRNDTILGISKHQLIMREAGKKLDYAATTIPMGWVTLFFSDRFMEHSLVEIRGEKVVPLRYDYQRSGGKKDIAFQARFDWQANQIQMSNQDKAIDMPANPQDLMSFQLALMDGLYKGQRNFSFNIVDHKRIRLQSLDYNLTVKMKSSHGELDVFKLDHASKSGDYQFSFWCAQQLDFLPILIRKTENDGDITELKLKRFNHRPFSLPDDKKSDEP